jgi:sterol 3beta-glucosyltransferase
MKILLFSVGTRGDMEPFVALGTLLKKHGHKVILSFPEQFRSLSEEANIEFASLGKKFIDLLDSPAGRNAMGGGSGFKKILGTLQLALNQKEANKELVQNQYEITKKHDPERIIYNGKSVYPMIWALDHPGQSIFISPLPYMHYVKGHSHIAFNGDFGTLMNKLTFALAHFGLRTTVKISNKWLGEPVNIKNEALMRVIRNDKSIYTISPSLFSRPVEWPPNLQVLGFQKNTSTKTNLLDLELQDFISRHDKVLFVTFGSMINPQPEKNTRFLLEVLLIKNIAAIINTAEGGLLKPDEYDEHLFFFTKRVNYEALFPIVFAVMHHGGAGTTHLGLKNACATLIIPHIIDQFVWNRIVSDLGAGPKGPRISKFRSRQLESKILELMSVQEYKSQAEKIARQMSQEDFEDEILRMIIA